VLGSSLVGYREKVVPANLVGAFGVLAAAGVAIKGYRERARSDTGAWRWWTLLAFALASMLLIAAGRRLPISRPVPSRYLTFANLYWVALAVLLVRAERRLMAVALLVPALTMMTAFDARELYIHRKLTLLGGRAALYAPIDSPVLGRFFWSSDFVLSQLSTLRRLHLSVYDCSRQLSRGDWEQAAATIRRHSRPGDVVVTSNDWGAACLTEHLRGSSAGVSIISAGESQAKALAALDGKQAAFLISGGDVGSFDARTWIERHGFPLYRSPIGSLRLLYYPDRVAFVRDRLGSDEIAADRTRFEGDGDLIAADDDRFFLWGWDHPQTDAQGRYRSILTHSVSLYVPVVRRSPAGLRIEFSDALLLGASRRDVAVTTIVNDVPAGSGTLAQNRLTLHMDLWSAAWRYGANIVRLELDNGGRAEPPVVEPLLIVRRVIFE
jgi:hypothetical protein